MATEVATPRHEPPRQNPIQRFSGFVREVRAEMDKVTWPDKNQVRQLSIFVVLFTILVGLLIAAIDMVMQGVLVRLIPSLFGRG